MLSRSRAREVALQLLYQSDFNPTVDRDRVEEFIRGRIRETKEQQFCSALYDGVRQHLAEIDQMLSSVAENWRLPRMHAVDRNVLRLGVFELVFDRTKPVPVVINEAIELARRFGSKDSPAFVNGLLDRIARDQNLISDATPETI
jgi:N utilization substance protein B